MFTQDRASYVFALAILVDTVAADDTNRIAQAVIGSFLAIVCCLILFVSLIGMCIYKCQGSGSLDSDYFGDGEIGLSGEIMADDV